MGDRRAGRRLQGAAAAAGFHAGAGHAGGRLQRDPHRAGRFQPAARRAVCARRPVCGAHPRLPHLRAPSRIVAALSSGAAHRRPVAGHRARRQGHRDDRPLHHAGDRAHDPRIRADRRHLRLRLWLALSPGGGRHRLALHLVHGQGEQLAHLDPPRDERVRYRGQHQGDQFAAQLRDRQIFQQREDGGRALRSLDGALRGCRHQDLDLARLAEFRARRDLRPRHDHRDVAVGPRGHCRHPDGRRFRVRQRHADAAFAAAQFHRHDLPRDPPGPHRHRADVRPARCEAGGARPAGRHAARPSAPARSSSATCISPTSRPARSSRA